MANRNFRYVVRLKTPKPDGKPDFYAQSLEDLGDGRYKLQCANTDGSLREVTLSVDVVGVIEDLGAPKM